MSVKVMSLVWDNYPGSGSALLAMLALADWCNDQGGSLHPSMDSIAQKIRVSKSQAQRIVHSLIAEGWLSVVGNEFGGAPGTTRQYMLNVKKLSTGSADAARQIDESHMQDSAQTGRMDATRSADATGRMDASRGVAPMRQTGRTHATQTISEPSVEPPIIAAPAATAPAKRERAQSKTRLPADFYPNETGIEKAEKAGVSLAVELESFRDYHAGQGSLMADWQAAWRTWVGNAVRFGRGRSQAPQRRTIHDERAETIAKLTGRDRNDRSTTAERDITGESFRVA